MMRVFDADSLHSPEIADMLFTFFRPPCNAFPPLFFLDADTFKRRNLTVKMATPELPEEFLGILSGGEELIAKLLEYFFAGPHLLLPIGMRFQCGFASIVELTIRISIEENVDTRNIFKRASKPRSRGSVTLYQYSHSKHREQARTA